MIDLSLPPHSLDNVASVQLDSTISPPISNQRLDCLTCNYHVDLSDKAAFVVFTCNVRAFKNEAFRVWRCPHCRTIHCLDAVDLAHYYAKYPFAQAMLTRPLRLCYQNLYRTLIKHGLTKTRSLLDYGCGSGLLVQYLRQRGFINCHGYDPYAPVEGFGNSSILQQGPFDYILLQDVIEHVENPRTLLSQLDALLAPGGHILIGTPNATNIDLAQPHVSDYYNSVHVPYHLHLYTRESMESLGSDQGWESVDFCDRPYHDTRWFGLNARAWNEYQRLLDGTINTVFEPIKLRVLTSPKFLFYAIFGYWLSFKTEMLLMFRKRA